MFFYYVTLFWALGPSLDVTHRFNVLLESVDVLLEEVQRTRLAAVPREGRCACGVDRVHPVLQLHLARRLKTNWMF